MNIRAEKIKLIKLLLEIENLKVIESIKQILEKKASGFWDDLSITQPKEIEKASYEIKNGKATDYETFMHNYS